MGFLPSVDLIDRLQKSKLTIVAAADPAGDDPEMASVLALRSTGESSGFLIVQELFLTDTARLADVVLPAQAFAEREGTYTSGERRVQRFYPAIPVLPGTQPDFTIFADLADAVGLKLEHTAPALVFRQLANQVLVYSGLTYQVLSETSAQWPAIHPTDVSFSGTTYFNPQGLGKQLLNNAPFENNGIPQPVTPALPQSKTANQLVTLPINLLYDRGKTLTQSTLLEHRLAPRQVRVNPADASKLGFAQKSDVMVKLDGTLYPVLLVPDTAVPLGMALVPRSVDLPVIKPVIIEIQTKEAGDLP